MSQRRPLIFINPVNPLDKIEYFYCEACDKFYPKDGSLECSKHNCPMISCTSMRDKRNDIRMCDNCKIRFSCWTERIGVVDVARTR